MTSTVNEAQHKHLLELIADEGEAAYDAIREMYDQADPFAVAALIDEVMVALTDAAAIENDPREILTRTDWTVYTHSTADEIAREQRWRAEDAVAAFLKAVA
jgi:hypothetical protein